MKKWEKPEVKSLSLKMTQGNPSTKGNDACIPDCIENAFQSIFGDHSGSKPPSNNQNGGDSTPSASM